MVAHYPFSPAVDALIDLSLQEDLSGGDLTSDLLLPESQRASAIVLAKEPMTVSGLGVLARVFARVDSAIAVELACADGAAVSDRATLARVSGPVRSMLRAERCALNFIRHMSGVATLTARYVAILGVDGPRLADTRKTTPGYRELEKYSVRMGGGFNHRWNLGAAIMIKDNHIAAVGSIAEAVARARAGAPHTVTIEVETTNLSEVDQALDAGADIIMLDNMSDDMMREAVGRCRGRALTEASGGITDERLARLAAVGVDVISSGALTHSAPAADISLDLE